MAAGQGFKTFTTGEVLSASDVNGYLMQGVLVFASATARDAAITSPQEGQFAYLKDTNVTTYYTGSAWANLDTTGMTNPMTTTGDTIYSSSGSTPARLGIGSTGQVLTVSGGVPTWAAPAGGGKTWTLLSTTAMSGSSSVTVSGISGKDDVLVLVVAGDTGTANDPVWFRINGDTGSNYNVNNNAYTWNTTYSAANFSSFGGADTKITFGTFSSDANSTLNGSVIITGCASTGVKSVSYSSGATSSGGNAQISNSGQGVYNASAAVTNITVLSRFGNNFSGGNILVYGA